MDKNGINVKMIQWFDQHFYQVEYQKEAEEGREPETIIDYIPSVTTKLNIIAKPFLAQWRGDIGNREANLRVIESQDMGSRLHLAWQVYTQGGAVVFNDYKRPAYTQQELIDLEAKFNKIAILRSQDEMYQMTKLQKFFEIINPIITFSETIVYDLKNRDAGTVDNLFQIKEGDYQINGTKPVHLIEGWYIFDLKTGKAIGDEARTQVAAYAEIVKNMGVIDPVGCIVGHTNAKTKGGIPGFSADVFFDDDIKAEYEVYRHISAMWNKRHGEMQPKVFQIPSIIYKEDLKNDTNENG